MHRRRFFRLAPATKRWRTTDASVLAGDKNGRNKRCQRLFEARTRLAEREIFVMQLIRGFVADIKEQVEDMIPQIQLQS